LTKSFFFQSSICPVDRLKCRQHQWL